MARDGKTAATKGLMYFYFSKPILCDTGFQKDQWRDDKGCMQINRKLFKMGLKIGECKKAEIIIKVH